MNLDTYSILSYIRLSLSFNARNYIEKMNIDYRDSYFKIENLRDGDGTPDVIYPYPWLSGGKTNLNQLINILLEKEYHDEYIEIQNIYSKENDIIWNEIVAMNWIEGNTDTIDDNSLTEYIKYTHKKFIKFPLHEQDPIKVSILQKKAKDLLYNESYIESYLNISEKYKNIFNKVLIKLNKNENRKTIIYFSLIILILTLQIFINFFDK